MTEEESPAQRAARLRRERREAKIKSSGTARLEKITSLSGRSLPSLQDESPSPLNSPSPSSELNNVPRPGEQQQQSHSPLPSFDISPNAEEQPPEDIKAQEEYLRALLRSEQPSPSDDDEDPTAKLISSLLNAPPPPNVSDSSNTGDTNTTETPYGGGIPELSADDLSSALGIPSSIVSFFLKQVRGESLSPAAQRRNTVWQTIHILFAFIVSLYFLKVLQLSISVYGGAEHLPPPPTMQNPFVILATGELFLTGVRMLLLQDGNNGGIVSLKSCGRIISNIIQDGRIMVFVLGIGSLWTRKKI